MQPPLPDEPLPMPLPTESGPVNRPTIGRSASTKQKKKGSSSRLSFGPGEIISGDAAEALEDDPIFTPKKATLGRRVVESNATRRSLPAYSIPIRGGDDEDDRPTYSKDYLNELKSSTPTAPKDLPGVDIQMEDEEAGLDASELEGAMIVDTGDSISAIPTDAEVREKKERRARLAKEKDFISLDDGASDNENRLSLLPRKKKIESRLVREDEDLAEGFDDFVEDGRISLGRKAERAAKKKHRQEMAELIHEAEGSESDASDDSEAERRAAYEMAQTRAGMDGLGKHDERERQAEMIPPKITPLPNLNECLQRLQSTLGGMQLELKKREARMTELRREKAEILAREEEVQRLLKEAGERFSTMRTQMGLPALHVDSKALIEGQNGGGDPLLMGNRGLESFGNTPVGRDRVEDIG